MEQIQKTEKLWPELRISVAMATYNGEKYIEEQLLSICHQTRKPDEIVVSDDGSKDKTLEIVERVSKSVDAQGIDFVVITDNPRHGFCGNFEWAIKHTSGDYIFLSDQDDVWVPEKVQKVITIFKKNSDAECVCHNASLIGKKGESIEGVFDEYLHMKQLEIPLEEYIKMNREDFLETSVSWRGIHGMSMCVSKKLMTGIHPFPNGGHDKWITFCAIANDSMYYYNAVLTLYRLHGNNTVGNLGQKRTLTDRVRRAWRNIARHEGSYAEFYRMGLAIKNQLEKHGFEESSAYITASRLVEIGEKTYSAETSNRIVGAAKICKLFCTDIRYRRSGTNAFISELIYIIMHSKKERLQNAGVKIG